MHEPAVKHGNPLILSTPLQCETKLGFNFVEHNLNRCGMVGVDLGASLEGVNQIWREKRMFLHIQITI